MRTLYQHSARRSTVTHKYVAAVTARGAEVRTLDEFFNRMIVVDRRVAIDPDQDDLAVALAIREPAVVAYLVDVFERSWERARPFTNRETSLMKDIAAEQRAMTMRMLIEGHADPVERQAARRQPAHLRRLRRRPQGGVRGGDPLPARLHDGPAGRLGQRAPRRQRERQQPQRED